MDRQRGRRELYGGLGTGEKKKKSSRGGGGGGFCEVGTRQGKTLWTGP